jgi:FMN-dependent NADH-azoreductase
MCNILDISSSPRGAASYSKQVAENVISDLRGHDSNATLTVRDLAQLPLPHIDEDFVIATRGADGPQTQKQRALLAQSDALIDELIAALARAAAQASEAVVALATA